MARVLIAGCGYVGSVLAQNLVAEDHEVWGLRRRPSALPAGVQPLTADLGAPQTLKELPSEVDVVFYLVSPVGPDDPHYRTACVDGVRAFQEVLERQPRRPRRLFFASSSAVYAQQRGEWVDEASATEPSHHSGRRLLQGEELVLRGAIPATVVRFTGIYGPRRTRLVDQVRAGNGRYRSRRAQWTNRIHRDDAAGALRHLMSLEKPAPLYLGTDCEPSTDRTVQEWLAGALGAPVPRGVSDDELSPRGLRSNKRCRNKLLLDSGYSFEYPSFREGYRALIESLPG
jgi:nucleoside-diphosphate-sugar epimerase